LSEVRLYAAAITLLVWALVWALGVRGDAVIGVGLLVTGAAAVFSEMERSRRRARKEP
jgi:hypothetical protein